MATRHHRILPTFVIIGAQRAGTTSLFHYLQQHPHVTAPYGGEPSVSWSKELHFFDKQFHRGIDWYRSFFPFEATRRLAQMRGGDLVAGEATPYYLFHHAVPERMAATLPDARVIALLRNPIERAYSHYHLSRRKRREKLSFADAVAKEEKRLARKDRKKSLEALQEHRLGPERRGFRSYLTRGMYADQLERWYGFFPREQILVIRSEDMQTDPAATYAQVLDFIGVKPWSPGNFIRRNKASYAPIDAELRRRLEERFAEPNRRLAELLGRDFGWAERTPTTL